jgi:hypothetical protein
MHLLEEDIKNRPWATHSQRSEFLYVACGVEVSEATICRAIKRRLGNSRKNSTAASERDEWLRLVWRWSLATLEYGRLVLVDEMRTHTSLAPGLTPFSVPGAMRV